jgi:hypothetical protein
MCNSKKKLPVGDGDDPGPQLLGHLICLLILIINIYGLGVGISTINKFTSGRGGVWAPGDRAIRHLICLVTLIINIYGLGVGISTIKSSLQVGGWVWPRGLSYNAFNLPSHHDHKYIWFRVGISVTFFYTDSPAWWSWAPGIKNVECTTSHWHLDPYQILSFNLL